MSYIFPFLHSVNISPSKDMILRQHQSDIIKSGDLNENLSILSTIQRITFYTLSNEDILKANEKDILAAYKRACMVLVYDLNNKKGRIKVEIKKLGSVDKRSFLSELEKHDYASFKDIQEWGLFEDSLSEFVITLNSFEKFADLRQLIIHNPSTKSSSQKASLAKSLIRSLLKEISPEEREKLENVGVGKKGLKSVVRERISDSQFSELFNSNSKTYQNRWSEVLNEQKSKD